MINFNVLFWILCSCNIDDLEIVFTTTGGYLSADLINELENFSLFSASNLFSLDLLSRAIAFLSFICRRIPVLLNVKPSIFPMFVYYGMSLLFR